MVYMVVVMVGALIMVNGQVWLYALGRIASRTDCIM